MTSPLNISPNGKRTVLVVEDSELNREMLRAMLEEHYNVLEAENGQVGLEILHQHYQNISIIVLDVQMPVMNGYEFLQAVNEDQLLQQVPILVATGSQIIDEEERCLEMGASDFVTKPYNRSIVLSRIGNIIKLKESASALSDVEFDELTGIYTRQAFFHHADRLLKQNPHVDYCLVISQIVDFTQIRERYGQQVADDLVRENVHLLKTTQPKDAVLGRYSQSRLIAMEPYSQKYDLIKENYTGNTRMKLKREGECVLKYGSKTHLDHKVPTRIHCAHAMAALKQIIHQYGHYYAIFDDELSKRLERQTIIEHTMEAALRNEQFRVYYQPKHDAKTGMLVGAEALVRWQHPQLGQLSPAEFIPIFESTGFISEVDHYVWRRTCRNIARWTKEGYNVVPISVNCSRYQLLEEGFINKWMQPIYESRVNPNYLHLEVTEGIFVNQMSQLADVLTQCREKGIKIELDDFGSGYSSLSAFQLLPLDVVKLDLTFMRNLHNPRQVRVIEACVNMVRALNLTTVAEGVENEAQLSKVRELGVDTVQGYYYSPPISERDFEQYMRSSGKTYNPKTVFYH